MATGKQVIERLAPLTGLRPATLDRQLRAQRLAGQLPAGLPGGGKLSAHFETHHLAAVLIGLAGPMPSDAPEAAVALRSMPYRGTQNPPRDVSQPLPMKFEDQLVEWIDGIAAALGRGHPADDPGFAPIRSIKLGLCLNPLQAIITVGPDGPDQTTIIYAANPEMPFAVRRLTILSGDLLMAAGELVADSIEQNAAIAAVQFLGKTQPAKATPGQESAENLRQEASAPFRSQPRANGTDRTSNTPEGIRQEIEFQAGLVTPPKE